MRRPSLAKGKEAGGDDKDEVARIAIVDLEAGKMLRSIEGGLETEGIEFSADGQHILVTNEEADTVTVHHIASGKLVKTIDTKPYGDRPRGIKMAPDGKSYVATLEHGDAFVVHRQRLQGGQVGQDRRVPLRHCVRSHGRASVRRGRSQARCCRSSTPRRMPC